MDKLRDFLKSWPGRILLILCLSPLALLGIESYLQGSVDPNEIAHIGDSSISINEYQTAVNARRSEVLDQLPDASLLNEDVLYQQVLKGLIDRKLLEQQAGKLGMTVSDETINRLLREEDIFKDAQGEFSNEKFATFLRQRGMTKDQLFAEFRNQLSLDQLNSSIVGTAIYPMAAVNKLIDIQLESRQVWLHRINWQDYADQVTVTPEAIKAYYESHKDSLKSKAMVDLAYIQLTPQTVQVPEVTEEDIQQQYAAYKQSLTAEDDRELAQILVTGADAQQQAAKIKAELDQGANFAQLAKRYSEDPTGQQGGAIGRFNPSVFGNDAANVEAALQGLTVGEVSQPVKTSYGYQIFTVTKDNSADVPSLDSMREELTAKAAAYKREAAYADKITAINDLAADGFSMEDIAQQEGLQVRNIKDYSKTDNQSVLSQPAVINQAFDDFTIHDQAVTTGIEVANGTVWVQPTNYRPIQTLSLDQARNSIAQLLRQQKATKLALNDAKKIAQTIKVPADINKQSVPFQALGQVNRQSPQLSNKERSIAFSEPAPKDGVVAIAIESEQGASILVADALQTQSKSALSDEQKAQTAAIIRDNLGQDQLQDYLEYLRMVYDIKMNEANLAGAQGR
ncbi:SurA N-terminal domain-containing protein [Psychrobacter pygoscelis]|uniref:SurA N-terminal domain-containing protein n=1 Tax=Psychrobacter pygoscelis TaxID=2488563 RepID=UPI00103CBAB0|nr:SurA N-terminal domain-containing protein [Psychrobacter pygoscelis]